MFDLYTFPTPNGRKVSIALEELGLPYTTHLVDITKGEQFAPEFLALSPNNKIPALHHREASVTLMESGAILIYLADQTGQLWGDARYETLQWLMLQMGGVGPMLGQVHHFVRHNPGKAPYAEERFSDEARRLYGVLDARLEQVEYLAGSYSIADIATWPWISRYEWHPIDWVAYPNLLRWYKSVAARPAVQRGYHVPVFVNEVPVPD